MQGILMALTKRKSKLFERTGEQLVQFGDLRFRCKEKTIPAIVMQGEWLRELGFEIGDWIQVECSDGKLTITKAETAAVDPGIRTAA